MVPVLLSLAYLLVYAFACAVVWWSFRDVRVLTGSGVLGFLALVAALARLQSGPAAEIDVFLHLAVLAAIVILFAGLWLFVRNHALPTGHEAAKHTSMTSLAVSLMTGGAVGLLLFALQIAQARHDDRLQKQELDAQKRADFRLAVAVAPDLSGFTPPRHPKTGAPLGGPYSMVGVHLSGKRMPNATLDDVDLRGAHLRFTHLGGSTMTSVDLRDGRLRAAFLRYADLRCSCLRRAKLVQADLSNADLRGVDLSGADLRLADLRGVLTDADTLWPDEPMLRGACRERSDTDCGGEARGAWDIGVKKDGEPARPFVPRKPEDAAERNCTPLRPAEGA